MRNILFFNMIKMALSRNGTPTDDGEDGVYFSRKMEFHVQLGYKLGNIFSIWPMKWNPKEECFEEVGKLKTGIFYFNIAIHLVNMIFVCARAVQALLDPTATPVDQILSQFMAFYWTLAFLFQLQLFLYDIEMREFVRQCLKYFHGIHNFGKEFQFPL